MPVSMCVSAGWAWLKEVERALTNSRAFLRFADGSPDLALQLMILEILATTLAQNCAAADAALEDLISSAGPHLLALLASILKRLH